MIENGYGTRGTPEFPLPPHSSSDNSDFHNDNPWPVWVSIVHGLVPRLGKAASSTWNRSDVEGEGSEGEPLLLIALHHALLAPRAPVQDIAPTLRTATL